MVPQGSPCILHSCNILASRDQSRLSLGQHSSIIIWQHLFWHDLIPVTIARTSSWKPFHASSTRTAAAPCSCCWREVRSAAGSERSAGRAAPWAQISSACQTERERARAPPLGRNSENSRVAPIRWDAEQWEHRKIFRNVIPLQTWIIIDLWWFHTLNRPQSGACFCLRQLFCIIIPYFCMIHQPLTFRKIYIQTCRWALAFYKPTFGNEEFNL